MGLGSWYAYDGYVNEKFQAEHVETNEQGEPVRHEEGNPVPDSTLAFNRKSPPFFLAGGLPLAGYFFAIKGKKVVAGEKSLTLPGIEIQYDSIEKINKTFFDKKG